MTLTVAAPPPWAQRFRSDDVDEVREFVTRGWGHHSRVMCGEGALGFEQAWVTGAEAVTGWVRAGLGETLRATARDPILHLAVPAGSTYRFGRRQRVASCGNVTFIAPGLKKRLDAAAKTARDETTRLHLHEMSVQVARLTRMGAP